MTNEIIRTMCIIVGLLVYGGAWRMATYVWQRWAEKKAGAFWDYSLKEGNRLYCPGRVDFMRNHRLLYKVAQPVVWPVMLAMDTKALSRVMSRHYY